MIFVDFVAPTTRLVGGALLIWAGMSQAAAGNFAECILDKMPGSSNFATNTAVFLACGQEYPNRYLEIRRGSGRGLLGFKDGNACTIKKAAGTTFPASAGAIAVACRCLYDEPPYSTNKSALMCESPPVAAPALAPAATPLPEVPPPPPAIEKSAEQQHYDAIYAVHPDARSIAESPHFSKWISGQGKRWAEVFDKGTAGQVIAMFNAYKADEQKRVRAEENRQAKVLLEQDRQWREKANLDMQAAMERAFERFPYLRQPEYAHVVQKIAETRDQLISEGVYPSIALTRAVNDHAYAYDPRGQRLPIVEVAK